MFLKDMFTGRLKNGARDIEENSKLCMWSKSKFSCFTQKSLKCSTTTSLTISKSICTKNFFWIKMQLSLLRNEDTSSLSQTPKLWEKKLSAKSVGKTERLLSFRITGRHMKHYLTWSSSVFISLLQVLKVAK